MTGIEWVKNPDGSPGITVNSKTGCKNHTPDGLCLGGMFPCYAFKLANGRLKRRYISYHGGKSPLIANYNELPLDKAEQTETDPFYPRWWLERLEQIKGIKKPTGIFLDDMSDWMGDYWPSEWTEAELQMMRDNPQHRIYTLTKQPQNLIRFSPFPPNVWLGVTVTNQEMFDNAIYYLKMVEATVKFISMEPLLRRIDILSLIGYNTDYEGKEQRGNSLSSSAYGGIGDRCKGKDLENQGSNIRQVEGWKSNYQVPETQNRERHREISPSEGNDKQGEILRSGQQASMVSLQRQNSRGLDCKSQERQREGQSPRKFGTIDLQPTDKTLNRGSRENLQERQPWPFSWVIIGALTFRGNIAGEYPDLTPMPYGRIDTLQPRIEWVREIVEAADKAGIKVFLKDNLKPLLENEPLNPLYWANVSNDERGNERVDDSLRQEMPVVKRGENG